MPYLLSWGLVCASEIQIWNCGYPQILLSFFTLVVKDLCRHFKERYNNIYDGMGGHHCILIVNESIFSVI